MPAPSEVKHDRVLIVDDDPEILHIIQVALQMDGFDVEVAMDGDEALERAMDTPPDVIVLDVMMPRLDGLEVCKRLRENYETRSTTVILLTARVSSTDKMLGFRAGADDYVTKPFDPDELVERVRATLRRNREMTSLSPLTGLPGNLDIERELMAVLAAKADFALLHIDIDNFKAYNDAYGVLNGDQAIKLLARCIRQAVREVDRTACFVGHVGGDDFAVLCPADVAPLLAQRTIDLWDRWMPMLYDQQDAERGYVRVLDRRKRTQKFRTMTLSIGIATTQFREFETHLEVADIAAEMKQLAKRDPESSYSVDRRRTQEELPPGDPRSVLIVDDDADMREVLRLHCEYLGFHVSGQGSNGAEAISLAGELQPAFVILDHRMPVLEGQEAAAEIRRIAPDATIVAFSAIFTDKPPWADEFLSKEAIRELTPFLGKLLDGKSPPG